MKFKQCFMTMLATLLCACSIPKKPAPFTGPDVAHIKLAEAASSVSRSLNRLARIEQTSKPRHELTEPPLPNTYGMGQLASIDWNGPIEPIMQQIAGISEYKLRVLGRAPIIPVLIFISANNQPLGDILRDIGYQAKEKAKIIVFPHTRVIELRYAKY